MDTGIFHARMEANPIVLDDYSEPQPDLTLLAARSDYYVDAHPRPSDVLLTIEVMDACGEYVTQKSM